MSEESIKSIMSRIDILEKDLPSTKNPEALEQQYAALGFELAKDKVNEKLPEIREALKKMGKAAVDLFKEYYEHEDYPGHQ